MVSRKNIDLIMGVKQPPKHEGTGSGKQSNQKMKPYLVYQYLLKNTDENHFVTAEEIAGYLQETCGIAAERRSIYKDIDAINKAIWMLENNETIDAVEDLIEDGDFDDEKAIVYDKHFKGFYVRQRKYEASDIRVIAECIYASNFIPESEAKRLVNIMKDFVSIYQAFSIYIDAAIANRVKTPNKSTMGNISVIRDAMSKLLDGERHQQEKISFKYLKYSINDINNQIERHQGLTYVVSPYRLTINDGNYYLLAFDDYSKSMRHYRVDRMKAIKRTGIPREGSEQFMEIDPISYMQRTFSMYRGEPVHLIMRFKLNLLDTIIEKFGKMTATYSKSNDEYFTVSTDVEISPQFYGWLCGFGKDAQIIAPQDAKDAFLNYIKEITEKYKEIE